MNTATETSVSVKLIKEANTRNKKLFCAFLKKAIQNNDMEGIKLTQCMLG
jgi:hypothetical protein